MKAKIAKLIAAVALMTTASASLGCVWFWTDEPKAIKSLID